MKDSKCLADFLVPELEVQEDFTIKASNNVGKGYQYQVCYECTAWGSKF